jgi:hypothetical protein
MSPENVDSYMIHLYLENTGNTRAEFTGEPILTYVETNDTISFTELTWRTGSGTYLAADTMMMKRGRKFSAYLSWERYPRSKDTLENAYFDTVYTGIGGNIKKSNMVIVKVSNLPVVIDSLKVSTRTFKPNEKIWNFNVHDSILKLHLKMYARDLDGKTPEMTISGSNFPLEKYAGEPFHVSFPCPAGPFKDTILFNISDHAQGQEIRALFIERFYQNVPPVIDSIDINSKSFKFINGYVTAVFEKLDTLRFSIFCHDTYDSVKTVKWKVKYNKLQIDTVNNRNAAVICTTTVSKTAATRKITIIDTVRIALTDLRMDSTIGYVIIAKGISNKIPVIKSIKLDSIIVNDTNTSVTTVSGPGNMKKKFSISVYDPDSNQLTCSWKTKFGKLDTDTGLTVFYTPPNQLQKDSITISVSDNESVIKSYIVFNVNDLYPVFDSLTINKTSYKKDSAAYIAYFKEQVVLTGWIRDLDKTDTARFTWKVSDSTMINSRIENRMIIQTTAIQRTDTIRLTVVDGSYTRTFLMYINNYQPEPVIDSLKIHEILYKNMQKDVIDSAKYPDTVGINIFAHDYQNDTISFECESLIKGRIVKVQPSVFKYILKDSVCVDTVSLTVQDTKFNKNVKKVILKIKDGKN